MGRKPKATEFDSVTIPKAVVAAMETATESGAQVWLDAHVTGNEILDNVKEALTVLQSDAVKTALDVDKLKAAEGQIRAREKAAGLTGEQVFSTPAIREVRNLHALARNLDRLRDTGEAVNTADADADADAKPVATSKEKSASK